MAEVAASSLKRGEKSTRRRDRVRIPEIIGFLVLFLYLLMTIAPGLLSTHDPLEQSIPDRFQYPSEKHWFGTDELGRDLYSRCIYGARTSVTTAFIAVMFSLILGVITGLFSGYTGGRVDELLARANDILLSFPGIIIAMALIALTGRKPIAVALVIGLVNTPSIFRVTRAVALQVRVLPYVDAVRSAGASRLYIMFKTVLPNCTTEIFVQALLIATRAIIVEASLSFLGLGIPPPAPSWGAMLNTGRSYLYQMFWYGIIPGVFIMMLVLSLQFVSRYLRRVSRQ
jgi:ABC-type dipeptide/oligopeptide/nickel transport system permease subunit